MFADENAVNNFVIFTRFSSMIMTAPAIINFTRYASLRLEINFLVLGAVVTDSNEVASL